MSDQVGTDELPFRHPSIQRASDSTATSDLLTYLAFEGHAIRIGLELSLSVILFQVLNHVFPWNLLGVEQAWSAISSWFASCITVILFDQLVLCRSVYNFRKAYQLSLSGGYEAALKVLEKIAPEQNCLVRCPRAWFHLLRAEILGQTDTLHSAEIELELARQAGAKGEQISIAKSKLRRQNGSDEGFVHAHRELEEAKKAYGETPVLCLEESLLMLEQHKDLWEAKRKLKALSESTEEIYYAGDTTRHLAKATWEATRLWTGEAEEGLEGLNMAIERLRSLASYVDTLRPILALLHLERALYLATHKEPELACFDLRVGLSLCNAPNLRKKAEKVQDELAWRYQILALT